jgi:lactate dehydrogenase-like 2-hydroxyacid dehydrogenase
VKALTDAGHDVTVSEKDGVLTKNALIAALGEKPYEAVLCLLTDMIDDAVFAAAPQAKIFANYAVGFNNIDLPAAAKRGVKIANTPGVLTDTVAEHTFALILAVAHRIAESDRFTRAGRYDGWAPMMLLGIDLKGKTLGLLGAGRIGSRVAHHARDGFDMQVIYYDVKRNEAFEQESDARFKATVEEVLAEADVVSIHVPLLDSTHHLMNAERFALMKPGAILVNTSRGPVVDEAALVDALKMGRIRGAGLDVFENEPALAPGLAELPNVVLTPHTASATEETRAAMAVLAAENIIAALEGREPPNAVAPIA